MKTDDNLDKKINNWWDAHPFTWGISQESSDLVGRIDRSKMDLNYFEEIERKFRKHCKDGAQKDGAPLLSNLIDYGWLRGKKVLDIATGSGFAMIAFIKGGADVTGIDLTDFAVEQAKKNLACRNLQGEVIKMDAQQMNFSDKSFDFVNAWGCLMHMPDTQKAINEIYRVLKPNGKALAYMYNKNSWPFWFNLIFLRGVLLGQLIRYRFDIDRLTSRFSDGFSVGGNPLAKFYTPKQAAAFFKNAGFEKIEAVPWQLPHEPDGWPMKKFPIFRYLPAQIKQFLSKRWGYGLIVRAEK
ncbi:MAG: class I SAM-dependent methyltransferase [Patescibacteria group bacterium]